MTRPRLLLVPTVSEVEWRVRPHLDEWAVTASYDAPGVEAGAGAGFTLDAVIQRGLEELDRLGWDRYVVVGDEYACAAAARIAAARPERVAALALGHACLSLRSDGPAAPINADVRDAFVKLSETDYGAYVRALGQLTQHAYDDEWVDAYRRRVPKEAAAVSGESFETESGSLEEPIRSLGCPLLFVEHRGCLLFTREGFAAAAEAFPRAETASTDVKPSADPRFSEILREFCASLAESSRAGAPGQPQEPA